MIHTRFWVDSARRYGGSRGSVAAAAMLAVLVGFCLLYPVLSPHDPTAVEFAQKSQGASLAHPLGTDGFGRDLLTRLAVGGRMSMLIAVGACGLLLAVGFAYWAVAGLAGGKVDETLMRLLDGLLAIPRFLVLVSILVAVSLRANILTLMFALAVASWMVTARLVRGQVAAVKRRDFVRAAEALGARGHQVLVRHVVPNALGILLVAAFLELPGVILAEALVSVLGLGLNPPQATWGNLAQDGIYFDRLYLVFLPSAMIAVFAVSANLVADGLQAALDPGRTVERRPRAGLLRRRTRAVA